MLKHAGTIELETKRLAIHHTDTPASGKAMAKAGMKFEGRLRQHHVNNNGSFVDCDMYSILKSDTKNRLR